MAETKKAVTLAEALVAAQKEMPKVEKRGTNPHFKSQFVTLDDLLTAVLPVLNKHGIALVQGPTQIAGKPALETALVHGPSSEAYTSTMPLLLAKDDMQGVGAAITYARRYMLAAALGIAEGTDDDGNQASASAASRGAYLPETRVEPSAKRPESWAALAAGFNVLDVDPEWLKQAVFYKFGKDRTELDQGEKEQAFQMLSGVLMLLQENQYGPPEMFGFSREQLQSAFAVRLGGQVLDGPPWCVGMENPENSGRLGKAAWLEAQQVAVPGEEDIPFGKEGE